MSNGKTKQVPVSALHFTVGPLELGSNGEESKTAPFRMVARTGEPIEHWYWGKVVHDMSGLRMHKDRITIDYVHDEKEVIGYANHFDTDDGNLNVSGALVPFKSSDRATEIIHKSQYGVPYESSIYFEPGYITELREGDSAEVNGQELTGPASIISEWSLRGIAVCPYGADKNTTTELSQGETIRVRIKDNNMENMIKLTDAVKETSLEDETVEAAPITEETVEEKPAEADTVEAETESTPEPEPKPAEMTGKDFLEAFGNQGGVWFAEGKSFDGARELFMSQILTENEALKQRLSAADATGETEPVDFVADDDKKQEGFAGKIRIASR